MAATEPGQQNKPATKQVQKRPHVVREIIETLVLTLLIFLVIRFVIQSYHIDGASMQPGLNTNQLVVVNKIAYLFRPPQRGDVIVFHNPQNPSQDFIKRVIGIPGDTVRMDSTRVWVNDKELKEPYIQMPSNPIAQTWKVTPDHYFAMGDNRPNSEDSRSPDVGLIPKDYIIGKAVLVFWPLNTIHFIDTHGDVYKEIKAPTEQKPDATPTPDASKDPPKEEEKKPEEPAPEEKKEPAPANP